MVFSSIAWMTVLGARQLRGKLSGRSPALWQKTPAAHGDECCWSNPCRPADTSGANTSEGSWESRAADPSDVRREPRRWASCITSINLFTDLAIIYHCALVIILLMLTAAVALCPADARGLRRRADA